MRLPLLAALSAIMLLGACATVRNSPVNPFNWFGRSKADPVATATATTTGPNTTIQDDRPMMNQIVALSVDRMPGGAIITATGLPPRQGYWSARLLPENGGVAVRGVLSYQFRAFPPTAQTPQGRDVSREITVGLFVSDQSLAGVRTIQVRAAGNQRSSRR